MAPEESESESEDNSDDESTEQDHEEMLHEPAPLSPRQQVDGRTRSRNVKSDHHNFPCKKKRKRKWKGLGVINPTACVHAFLEKISLI